MRVKQKPRQFSLPLDRHTKNKLDRLHRDTGLSRADVLRQLLLAEHQASPEARRLAIRVRRRNDTATATQGGLR